MKMPNSLGATIDALAKIVEARAALTVKDNELKDVESILKAHLTANFAKGALGLDGARGKFGVVTIKRSTVADIQDWDKLRAYVVKKKAWDFFTKSVSITAMRLRWDNNEVIPGVEKKEIEQLKFSPIKKPTAAKK